MITSDTGRAVMRIEYKLGWHRERWRVHDVLVNGASLGDGFRLRFEHKTFDDLFARLAADCFFEDGRRLRLDGRRGP